MEPSLRIRTFEELPSTTQFNSLIESTNVPAVLKGCVNDWKAFSKWNPFNGGLDYLQERVGSCVVEAMLSKSAAVFYGDLRSHERVPIPFSDFIGFCKQKIRKSDDVMNDICELERNGLSESDSKRIYLAQVPIMHFENEDKVRLEALNEDIDKPLFLEERVLASVNLWMNSAKARSSTHYDPHHNLLCLVSGCKQVLLWPPSASPMLYPMPIYGEASNHSLISLENPDFSAYPRAKCLMECSQKVTMHPGDALFIPEGWFHQVDSEELTIAVNFWWRSRITSAMSEHMDAYYLRRILRRMKLSVKLMRLPQKPRRRRIHVICLVRGIEIRNYLNYISESSSDGLCKKKDLKGKEVEQGTVVDDLDPVSIQVLHVLVSLVHDRINVADIGEHVRSASSTNSASNVETNYAKATSTSCVQDDAIARILWSLEPRTFQHVFLAMAHNFPRTLEALILHLLSPVAAEVLTRKFEEMDQFVTEEERDKFYCVFYGAFDDQFAAMDSILNRKESFAFQALNNVLDKYLGVNCVGSVQGMR